MRNLVALGRANPNATMFTTLLTGEKEMKSINSPCPCGSGKKYKKCCRIKKRPQPIQLPPNWTVCKCGMKLPPERKCPSCENDGQMQRGAIVVDTYKKQRFAEELCNHGYSFDEARLNIDVHSFFIWTDNPFRLKQVVQSINTKLIAEFSN